MFTDLNRRTRAGLAVIAVLAVSNAVLGGINTFADRVKQDQLCHERQEGRDAVREGYVGTQATLVRFAQRDVAEQYGIASRDYRAFNQRASKYMITVRADALKQFPPVDCV